MESALCVLQAADLRLDEPIDAVIGLPPGLRTVAQQARLRTAAALFERARDEKIDLVLLTGPLANFELEPRLASWLADQFQQLQRCGTAVVVAHHSPQELLSGESWPTNVRVIGPQQSIAFPLARKLAAVELHWNRGAALLDATGQSCDLVISLESHLDRVDISYLPRGAIHGCRQSTLPLQRSGHQPGSSSGYWRVFCPPESRPISTLIPAAAVAWQTLELEVSGAMDSDRLLTILRERLQGLEALSPAELLLVEVHLLADAQCSSQLWRSVRMPELAETLRREISSQKLWCTKVKLLPRDGAAVEWSRLPGVTCALAELENLLQAETQSPTPQPWHGPASWSADLGRRQTVRELKLRVVAELGAWDSTRAE